MRGVDHQGGTGDIGVVGDIAGKYGHPGRPVEHRIVHAHVDDRGSVSYLAGGYAQGLRILPGSYEFGELAGAGHVGPLPYVGEAAALDVYGNGLQAAHFQYAVIRLCGNGPRRCTFQGHSDGPDVLRCGAAAAAGNVEQSFPGHGQHVGRHLLRGLVVGAHLVGQAGVGITAHGAPGK